jgi:hypothetical protein
MPTFTPVLLGVSLTKDKFASSSSVDSNSNLAYIKVLHNVTTEYSRTAKGIEEKVLKKLDRMQKKRNELIEKVSEQKQVS